MLTELRRDLREIVGSAQAPILSLSFGKDSMLLLHLLKEFTDIPCLVFKDFWNDLEFVSETIGKHKLACFHYAPVRIDAMDNSIVAYYNVGGKPLPVVTDVEFGGGCFKKNIDTETQPAFIWDTTITGSKKTDTHELVPNLEMDHPTIVTPLWDWTDEQVIDTCKELNIDHKDLSTFRVCEQCFKGTHYATSNI